MSSASTSKGPVERQVQRYQDSAVRREEARTAAAEAQAKADEERAAADELMAKCEQTRAQLKQMLEARRVYREDESGEHQYLDEVQREEARAKAEAQIEEYCG